MARGQALWTTSRIDLRSGLARVDGVLADLYGQLIDSLTGQPLTVARLVIASHCARELGNNLVDYLADVEGLPQYVSGSQQRQALASAWVDNKWGEVAASSEHTGASSATPGLDLVTVPRQLVDSVRPVVEVEVGASERAAMRMSALVTGRVDQADNVSVRLLRESLKFFQSRVHLRHGETMELPPFEEVLRHLDRFEAVLAGRVGDFFARKNEVMDLLKVANRRVGDASGA